MPLLLGCVADDFTGATDLANTLVRGGMRAVQVIGVSDGVLPEADAVVATAMALATLKRPPIGRVTGSPRQRKVDVVGPTSRSSASASE